MYVVEYRWREKRPNMAGTGTDSVEDAFAAAMRQLLECHQAQILAIRHELEGVRSKCRDQEECMQMKESIIQMMRDKLAKAKSKIHSQHEANKKLKERLKRANADSGHNLEGSLLHSADPSGDELDSAVLPSTPSPQPASAITPSPLPSPSPLSPTHQIANATNISLFGSPGSPLPLSPVKHSGHLSHSGDREDWAEKDGVVASKERSSVMGGRGDVVLPVSDSRRTGATFTAPDRTDMDITTGYPSLMLTNPPPAPVDQVLTPGRTTDDHTKILRRTDSNETTRPPEGISLLEAAAVADGQKTQDQRMPGPQETSKSTSVTAVVGGRVLPPKPLPQASTVRPGAHVRPLSLKDRGVGGGKVEGGMGSKVRYREVSQAAKNSSASGNLSTSSTSQSDRDSSHHDKSLSPSTSERVPSRSPSDSLSSGESPSSPSLLQSSDCHGNHQSPSILNANGIPGLLVTPTLSAGGQPLVITVPGSIMAGAPQVPRTDSQFSLDVSETLPPSPELHSTSRNKKRSKLNVDAIRLHQIRLLSAHNVPRGPSSDGQSTSRKPTLPSTGIDHESNGSDIRQNPISTSQEDKHKVSRQSTLTQTATNGRFHPSSSSEGGRSSSSEGGNPHHYMEDFTGSGVREHPRNILLATPGLKPVSVILGLEATDQSPSPSFLDRIPWTSGTKRGRSTADKSSGSQTEDEEEILPQKKMKTTCSETSYEEREKQGLEERPEEPVTVVLLDSSLESEGDFTEKHDETQAAQVSTLDPEDETSSEELSPEYLPTPERTPERSPQTPTRPQRAVHDSHVETGPQQPSPHHRKLTGEADIEFSDPNLRIPVRGVESGPEASLIPKANTTPLQVAGRFERGNGDSGHVAVKDKTEGVRGASDQAECTKDQDEYARALAAQAGLPTYKFVAPIRRRADRDKLDAKACPECQAWYQASDGIHQDRRGHLKNTCRHKSLYLPPDTDPRMWEISFPDSDECERIMK